MRRHLRKLRKWR
ncbi:hypothetical protein J1C79_02680 [Streptococcus sanguinis]